MFVVALFVIAQSYKQPKCLCEWMNIVKYPHNRILHRHTKEQKKKSGTKNNMNELQNHFDAYQKRVHTLHIYTEFYKIQTTTAESRSTVVTEEGWVTKALRETGERRKCPSSQLWWWLHGCMHVETHETVHLEGTQFILCWLLSFLYKWSKHSNYKSGSQTRFFF